ncbi:MAG: type II toxin-antitoxin system prevent-host-death family antitoxin [Roseiarcus sp.]|jgi:prevent-host-death family protein|uniref:type II toxin-antitoxin system prevent-host-death family antitoxin n=1 Tax=Roseiarcus sp. TaxID=1969460 RepID=UPI003C21C718
MELTKVTASEFQQAFGMLSDKARHEPVVITKHGRDSLVVMAAEEWARLKRRDRRVGLAAELPEEWVEAVRSAKVPDEFARLDTDLK